MPHLSLNPKKYCEGGRSAKADTGEGKEELVGQGSQAGRRGGDPDGSVCRRRRKERDESFSSLVRLRGKKSLKKKMKKQSARLSISKLKNESSDFLPLEGGSGKEIHLEEEEPVKNTSTVLYIGHIPHGFYEDQMEGFFKQFGKIKRLRIARNRKTGKSKHYGFLEFENPEVAKVVADEINNYLLFEHNLQLQLITPDRVPPKLWRGVSHRFTPLNWKEIARKKHNKDRTAEEYQRMIQAIVKKDAKRRKRIKAAGIDYDCPELIGMQPAAKKIKLDEEED